MREKASPSSANQVSPLSPSARHRRRRQLDVLHLAAVPLFCSFMREALLVSWRRPMAICPCHERKLTEANAGMMAAPARRRAGAWLKNTHQAAGGATSAIPARGVRAYLRATAGCSRCARWSLWRNAWCARRLDISYRGNRELSPIVRRATHRLWPGWPRPSSPRRLSHRRT